MKLTTLFHQASSWVFIILFVTTIIGCKSLGPNSIEVNRFDYNSAILNSRDEQTLLNLVRMRYGEAPFFLDVEQVVNQYQLGGSATVNSAFGIGGSQAAVGDFLNPQAGVSWTNTPTITYKPRIGPKYTSNILTPLRPSSVIVLLRSNHSSAILWLIVRSINGVSSHTASSKWNNDYTRMLTALSTVNKAGAIGNAYMEGKNEHVGIRFRDEGVDPQTAEAIRFLRSLWKLNPELDDYKLVNGTIPSGPDEIAILTTSMYDLMRKFASHIDVPPEHVKNGQTVASAQFPPEAPLKSPPIRVTATSSRPKNAFVAVQRDGWWFSIDKNDYTSKQAFANLNMLLELTNTEGKSSGPLITIGAGG